MAKVKDVIKYLEALNPELEFKMPYPTSTGYDFPISARVEVVGHEDGSTSALAVDDREDP